MFESRRPSNSAKSWKPGVKFLENELISSKVFRGQTYLGIYNRLLIDVVVGAFSDLLTVRNAG